MPEKEPDTKPTAPLISLRRSFQLAPPGVVALGIGMWLAIGVFGLFNYVRLLSGSSAGWAYLASALFLLPSTLAFVELRAWSGHTGGSYRLIRSMERNSLTFFAGWIYLLGWAGVSALLARIFAEYASSLLTALISITIPEVWFIVALLALFLFTNFFNLRPSWRVGMWVSMITVAFIGIITVVLGIRVVENPSRILSSSSSGSTGFFGTVVILIACMWIVELMAGAGDRRRRNLSTELALLIGGPLLGGLVALGGRWGAPGVGTLEGLAAAVMPGTGDLTVLVLGTVISGLSWLMLGLLMLRRLQVIGLDGWLPVQLLSPYTRFKTPILLLLVEVGLTVGALLLSPLLIRLNGSSTAGVLNLAAIAGQTFLLLQIGVGIAGIILGNSPRASDRSFRLPLYPAIPATAAAISALLLFATPWPVLALSITWLALGGLIYWRIGQERMRNTQLGVTVFQDGRAHSELRSPYPVLIPVANPNTALSLVKFGTKIARAHGGHVVVLQVIQVADQLPLDSGRVHAQERQDLLEDVLSQIEPTDVPIEGITRLARSISHGILDTAREETPHLIVMGWHARDLGRGKRGLGKIIDEVLENAASNVIIVRGDWDEATDSILVPAAGGPHAPVAAEFALDLTEDNGGEVTLLNVTREDGAEVDERMALLKDMREELPEPSRVQPRVIQAETPLQGILKALEDHDAILVGASELDFLDQQLFGQLPIQVAMETDKSMALVRGYTGLTELVARKAWSSVSDILPTLTPQEQRETYYRMRKSAQPNINFFVLIAASAVIATLGLLLNSAAVIIGAMLVAPLMSPFIALATGIVTGDVQTMRNGLTSILQGTLLAIFLAIVATLISPLAEATPEVLSRTQPNLLDLMIALTSGVAGAYAIARKEVGAALPGVAIAAALMPPLCSVGIGIALGNLTVAMGAFLLFTTNLVAIVFASAIVFLMLGMRPPERPERQRWLRQGLIISVVSLAIVSIPLGVVLYRAVQRSHIESDAQAIVRQQVTQWDGDTEIGSFAIDIAWRDVTIEATLFADTQIPQARIDELDAALEEALNRNVSIRLFVIEGEVLQTGDS